MTKRELSPTTKRIMALRALLEKDRSEYTAEDKATVRRVINKHAGTDWATDGYEGLSEE